MAKAVGKQPVKEDLYRIRIPGGTATFYREKELSNRRAEELAVAGTPAEGALNKIRTARKVVGAGGETDLSETLTGADVHLTREETRDILYLNNTLGWVLLKSWSLKRGGEPLPLPQSVDDLLDLPRDLHDALVAHAARIFATEDDKKARDSFAVDPGIEDQDSPTGP